MLHPADIEEYFRDHGEGILKSLGFVLSFAGFLFGVHKFTATSSMEARKPFLDQQLKLYMEATRTTSVIANCRIEGNPERVAAEARFFELYWGQLALVESVEVEKAMVDFQRAIVVPPRSEAERRDEQKILQHLSFAVAHACRNSIAQSWKVGLAEFSRLQNTKNSDDSDKGLKVTAG
jgi:hypothetical protein